jgi:hypothetical protein
MHNTQSARCSGRYSQLLLLLLRRLLLVMVVLLQALL